MSVAGIMGFFCQDSGKGDTLPFRESGSAMQIHLAKSDITAMPVDAVVNPANSLGIMGGGVSAALSRKGGPSIQKEAMSLAPIAVGAAVVTNAGQLWAKHVIHAPTMEQPGTKVGVENVRRATRAALLAAARHGFETIALPGMGTGLGGVDPADAARAIVDELRAHRQPKPATVYLVDIDDEILLCLEEALRLAVG
jgi:O-acetyl-ADP-ribose deacetylase (regulator of RNase III)